MLTPNYWLVATGSVIHMKLDIAIWASEDHDLNAKIDAGNMAQQLHKAGYYTFTLYRVTHGTADIAGNQEVVASIKVENIEPKVTIS